MTSFGEAMVEDRVNVAPVPRDKPVFILVQVMFSWGVSSGSVTVAEQVRVSLTVGELGEIETLDMIGCVFSIMTYASPGIPEEYPSAGGTCNNQISPLAVAELERLEVVWLVWVPFWYLLEL